jgi:hypothetical protein
MPASWDAKMLQAFAALSEFHVLWVRPPTHKMRVLAADPWDSFKGVAGSSAEIPQFSVSRADAMRMLSVAFGAPSADPKT